MDAGRLLDEARKRGFNIVALDLGLDLSTPTGELVANVLAAVAQWERSMTEYAHSLPADADPEDVQKVQHKLENARVKLAKLNSSADKDAH